MATDLERVRQALADAEFPAHKDELVRCALHASADAVTISAMLAIPSKWYASAAEVEHSVPITASPAAEGKQQPSFSRRDLEELKKNIAEHPVWQELGDSSGS